MAVLPSWDSLSSYIATYSGRTRIIRLLHIADTFPELQSEAYRVALDIIQKDTLDYRTYTTVVHRLNDLLDQSAPKYELSWALDAEKRANAITTKLENELKAYKNNLIKESIRMGQQDIARHWTSIGDLQSALRALVKNRDYCTTPVHVYQINMDIVNTGILLGQWAQVQTYVSKLEQSPATAKERLVHGAHLQAASALSLLNQEKYKEAAHAFLSIDSLIGSTYNHVISMHDIAKFTSLLAIATFSRADLTMIAQSSSFKPFLEIEVVAREALFSFSKSNYAECFSLIENFKGDMHADIYFSKHVEQVFSLIRQRSYVQFASAFKVVSISTISELFRLPIEEVIRDLWDLIHQGRLPSTRLDLKAASLCYEVPKLRSTLYKNMTSVSEDFLEEVRHAMLHLEITRADLQIDSRFAQLPSGAQAISTSNTNVDIAQHSA